MEKRDDYRFLKLNDAITCLNQKVNFIGVVLEYGFPKKSKGIDYFCSLKLTDETYPSPGISVNFFTESLEKLPVIASAGDIIQLSHVVMRTHEKEVYALFNKKFSAFALYHGNVGEDIVPYQVSSKFQKRDLDKKFVLHLRKWLLDLWLDRDPNDFQFLKEIKEGQRINLVCKVTAKFKCVVRIVAAFPWHAQDFLSPKGIYRIRLTLEDPTARLPAYVYAEDGERLFGGFPHHDVLKRKMNKLLGIDEKDNTQGTEYTIRNPPWMVCCVKSYCIHKDDVWGSRHFRIFGTKIVG